MDRGGTEVFGGLTVKRTALLTVAFVGAAIAQEPPAPAWAPFWLARPTAEDVMEHFPQRAIRQERPGLVVLCCIPQDDGTLACRVGSEWPEDLEYGEAALKMSRSYRVAPESVAQFRALGLSTYTLMIPWILEPEHPHVTKRRALVTETARQRNICAAPAAPP